MSTNDKLAEMIFLFWDIFLIYNISQHYFLQNTGFKIAGIPKALGQAFCANKVSFCNIQKESKKIFMQNILSSFLIAVLHVDVNSIDFMCLVWFECLFGLSILRKDSSRQKQLYKNFKNIKF